MDNLLSVGHSVRPKPLDLWLTQLNAESLVSSEDTIAVLNQLALVCYFNGHPDVAKNICIDTINFTKSTLPPDRHFLSIQSWVNIGRLELRNYQWSKCRPHFAIPDYLYGNMLPPTGCPIKDWETLGRNPVFVRFAWSIYLEGLVGALGRGLLNVDEFLVGLDRCSLAPNEFRFSKEEARLIARVRSGAISDRNINRLFKLKIKSVRQLAAYLARKSQLAFLQGNSKEGLENSIKCYLICHSSIEDETADPFLQIGIFLVRLLIRFEQFDSAIPMLRFLIDESRALNNEIIHYDAIRIAKSIDISISIKSDLLMTRSHYKCINPYAKDLTVKAAEVAAKCYKECRPKC